MRLKIKDMDLATGGPLVVVLNENDAKVWDLHQGDRVKIACRGKKAVAILNFAESIRAVPRGHIGCYGEVLAKLGARKNALAEISLQEKPKSVQYIKKKLNGETLSYGEFYGIVRDIAENRLSDIELTYFVSACHTNVMTMRETIDLTKAMINTGEVLKVRRKPVLDKHCVGGVAGNRTTMLVVPILAAAGITVPKTSSRSITSPAGTADTVEVLAPVSFTMPKMRQIVNRVGACMVWGGAINLAPADDRIIKVEHPLSIDSRSQLLASIIAKKASVSSTHVLVDIPIGRGAKIDNMKQALVLKKQFEIVGRSVGMKMKVIITDGSQPIGNGLGPALEARDVLWILRNDEKGPADLRQKSIMMAGLGLEIAGRAARGEGMKKARQILESGKAYRKFLEIIRAQGGREILPENIPTGKFVHDVVAQKSGRIVHIDNTAISKIARIAGAPLDKLAGIYLYRHKGDSVRKGELLYTIYASNEQRMYFATNIMQENNAFEIKIT
jgi:putative thymidine phosphorylase